MRDGLASTFAEVARAAAPARDPWWIVGSAALVLHGVDPGRVGDVDLLMSAGDAVALLAGQGIVAAPGIPDDRFRSAVFGRWPAGRMTVEVMGGFELYEVEGWCAVMPATREPIERDGVTLYVPSLDDLAALLRRFGRAKDLARARLLDQPIPRSAGPNACGSSSDRR